MKFLKNNLIFFWPVLSGALLILSYPPHKPGFLAFIALIPLFYFIGLKEVSNKKAFIGGAITGFIFLGKLFDWFYATAPFEWLGISANKDIVLVYLLIIIIWLFQNIFLSLFIGFFSWIFKKLTKIKAINFIYLLIIPCLWIIFEYLRAWGFGIFWLGKESLLGSHWTFGNLAYSFHNYPIFIQIADITGIYGISFLIVLINIILFLLITKYKKQKITLIILLISILLIWSGYGIYKINKPNQLKESYKIALLQTNFLSGAEFNPYQKETVYKAILELFQQPESIQEKPDFIIAPEGFGIVSLTKDKELTKYLLKDFWQSGQIFLENQKISDSPPHQIDGGGKNQKIKSRLFYYDLEKENPIGFHDKLLLVPGGDYLPYTVKGLLNIYSFNINYEKKLYQKGEKIEPIETPKGIIGGSICSSILSPDINRQMTKKGAEFLTVISSDAPFHGAKTLLIQNLAMSKLRAVENRRYFAQATNMGYSFLLNSKGQIVVKTSEFGNKILFSEIQLSDRKTVYTKYGDWIIVLALFLLLVFILKFSTKFVSLDFKKMVK